MCKQVGLDVVAIRRLLIGRVPVAKMQVPLIIPPSAAISAAMRPIPGAKAIGVKPRGNMYIIKLKQGNTVRQVRVNGVTGVVLP